jgi:hypothetical protein
VEKTVGYVAVVCSVVAAVAVYVYAQGYRIPPGPSYILYLYYHEGNIRGGGKTVHIVFKYLSRSLLQEG